MQEGASLVAAQVELSVVAEQEERLAQAELRALRAQISPHFIYNALAAVAGDIHARPEEARDLLTDFAEFTRYLFRDGRSYVTLGEEIDHVERYLRLPNYTNNLLRVTDLTEDDLRDGGSDRLVDLVVAWGDEAAIRERVDEHRAAGADHVCVQVIHGRAGELPLAEWRALAPALT